MPCSEDAAAGSISKRARAEDGVSLRFVRLSEHATAPTRGSARAAGYDLYSAYEYTIPPMEKAIVKTDIQIAVPSGCYGRVAGVIDEDYRGNVGVVLFNFGKEKFEEHNCSLTFEDGFMLVTMMTVTYSQVGKDRTVILLQTQPHCTRLSY
ncbi:deoxyuridine 5'-triphosphate nucleotidohydrolase-like protein [Cricetulus griseus]|nr:deoxyuridine 5'-triphosphate nucleotidohydrolase-like protein [Cricetulus griseus]